MPVGNIPKWALIQDLVLLLLLLFALEMFLAESAICRARGISGTGGTSAARGAPAHGRPVQDLGQV